MKRFMSIINIVLSLILAFLAFRILIMNGLNMNFLAVLLALVTIGTMLGECAFTPTRNNFLKKTLLLIGAYFLIFLGLNMVLPKTSLSLDTLLYYSYFIYLLIASFVVDLIGFFVLKDSENISETNNSKDDQAKLAKLKYQQQLKQQAKNKKQRKVRRRKKNKKGRNKKSSNNTSVLQAKLNADSAQQNSSAQNSKSSSINTNNNEDEIL